MSEYIVQAAEWAIDKNGNSLYSGCEEIVRCRDCKRVSFDEFGIGWCNENCREVKPWDFCAWTERRGV